MRRGKQADELQNFSETQGSTSIALQQQQQHRQGQGHEPLLESDVISFQEIEHREVLQNVFEDDLMLNSIREPPPLHQTTTTTTTNSTSAISGSIGSMLRDPMIQLFGIVFILFLLTAILATINFCIWYLERRRRRLPLHWRSSPGVEAACNRPVAQTPKRSFHIQHALYKTVRRPSAMPP